MLKKALPIFGVVTALAVALILAPHGTAFASPATHAVSHSVQIQTQAQRASIPESCPASKWWTASVNGAGTVYLYWSAACQTNWTVVKSSIGGYTRTVIAYLNYTNGNNIYTSSCGGNCVASTPMFYAPTINVQACGTIYDVYGHYNHGCYTQ